jgi:hypothetical protein
MGTFRLILMLLGVVGMGALGLGYLFSRNAAVIQPSGTAIEVRGLLILQTLIILGFLLAMVVSLFYYGSYFEDEYDVHRYLLIDAMLVIGLLVACLTATNDVWFFRIAEVVSGVFWLLRVYLTARDALVPAHQRELLRKARDFYFPWIVLIIGCMAFRTPFRAAFPDLSVLQISILKVGVDAAVSDFAFTIAPFLLALGAVVRELYFVIAPPPAPQPAAE